MIRTFNEGSRDPSPQRAKPTGGPLPALPSVGRALRGFVQRGVTRPLARRAKPTGGPLPALPSVGRALRGFVQRGVTRPLARRAKPAGAHSPRSLRSAARFARGDWGLSPAPSLVLAGAIAARAPELQAV